MGEKEDMRDGMERIRVAAASVVTALFGLWCNDFVTIVSSTVVSV